MKNLIVEKFKTFLSGIKYKRIIPGILIGGLAGFLYFHFIGCNSGSCPITSNPYSSILVGGLMGYLIADMF